jgi:hypothetical protein
MPPASGWAAGRPAASSDGGDEYQAQPEHREALRASGLLDAVTEMRSRVFDGADLNVR